LVKDHEAVYPLMMVDLLPSGLKGLMLASFFAAFMSTLSTYLNLSSAYFVNDFYRPFVKREAKDSHYIFVSRIVTLILSILTAAITYYTTSIVGIFKFLIAFGSGTGLVYIMRWFWWRINAWSEVSAMVSSTVFTILAYSLSPLKDMPYYGKLFFIISVSTAIWLVVTFLTKPVEKSRLIDFYRKTRPGIGWDKVASWTDDPMERERIRYSLMNWATGSISVIAIMIAIGKLLLRYYTGGFLWLCIAIISGIMLYRGGSVWVGRHDSGIKR
ncbi:MAG: sodium:solute symporter family transporter, partial [Thermodesulfovibrionales bacterium]